MPEAQDLWIRGQKQLCSAETFLHYLGVEIERYTRYNRAFTIVLIQPPASDSHLARLETTQDASEHALGLLRTCDVIAIFERSPCVVTLLPETGAAGARTVFDRFDEQMVQPGRGWTLKMATYPEHSASIAYFLQRFTGLLKSPAVETESSDRFGHLRHATSDVSHSWRDFAASK